MAEWLAVVGAVGGVTAGVIGAIEQHKQANQAAKSAEENANMQKQQMEYNRRMEEQEAAVIEAETRENARRQREASERLKASQRAAFGKSGALMTAGSPLAVLGETAADEEIKARDVHYSGARAAAAHFAKATDYGFGATIAGQNAHAARASRPSYLSLGANITGEVSGGLVNVGKAMKNFDK